MSRMFLLSTNGRYHAFGMLAQYKTQIIEYQTCFGYSVKNILETVVFKVFTKKLSGREKKNKEI